MANEKEARQETKAMVLSAEFELNVNGVTEEKADHGVLTLLPSSRETRGRRSLVKVNLT